MYIEMKVAGITLDPLTKMPIIILKDITEKNVLPIWIGLAEASAIATQLEHIDLARPMTHDLMRNILDELHADLENVKVNDLKDNTFYATLSLKIGNRSLDVDSRPSDAIALALRTESPVFVDENVIKRSKTIDINRRDDDEMVPEDVEKWKEILESLTPDAFGKYKI